MLSSDVKSEILKQFFANVNPGESLLSSFGFKWEAYLSALLADQIKFEKKQLEREIANSNEESKKMLEFSLYFNNSLDALFKAHKYLFMPSSPLKNDQKMIALERILDEGLQSFERSISVENLDMDASLKKAETLSKAIHQAADKVLSTSLPKADYYEIEVIQFNGSSDNRISKNSSEQVARVQAELPKALKNLANLLRIKDTSIVEINEYIKHQEHYQLNDPDPFTAQKLILAKELLLLKKLEEEKKNYLCFYREGVDNVSLELTEKAGGVTEKRALLTVEKCLQQLSNLNSLTSIEDFFKAPEQYKIRPNAILKFPKKGCLKELQKEITALAISNILGHQTTDYCAVSFENKPALFIPFNEGLTLLSEFARGEERHAFGSSKTYVDHSTIMPLGEGFEKNHFLTSIGNIFGLIYLCQDSDGFGGYNQNKGFIKDRDGAYQFLVFDQSIRSHLRFKICPGLYLQPTGKTGEKTILPINLLDTAHSRHLKGRNNTLPNNTETVLKIDSLQDLFKKQTIIREYLTLSEKSFSNQIQFLLEELKQLKTQPIVNEAQIKEKETLRTNIETLLLNNQAIMKTLDKRISELEKQIFNPIEQDLAIQDLDRPIREKILCQASLLEKSVHQLRLFNPLGNPYQVPLIYEYNNANPANHITRIRSYRGYKNDIFYEISFEHKIVEDDRESPLSKLQTSQLSSLMVDKKTIHISHHDLEKLKEEMLDSESELKIHDTSKLLTESHLDYLKKVYGLTNENIDNMQKLVAEYLSIFKSSIDEAGKLIKTEYILSQLQAIVEKETLKTDPKSLSFIGQFSFKLKTSTQDKLKNLGLAKHILKNVHLHYQHHLLSVLDIEGLEQAFIHARKLDRLALFNHIVTHAILNKKINSTFTQLIQTCNTLASTAKDHPTALEASDALKKACEHFLTLAYQPNNVSAQQHFFHPHSEQKQNGNGNGNGDDSKPLKTYGL